MSQPPTVPTPPQARRPWSLVAMCVVPHAGFVPFAQTGYEAVAVAAAVFNTLLCVLLAALLRRPYIPAFASLCLAVHCWICTGLITSPPPDNRVFKDLQNNVSRQQSNPQP